MRLKTWEYLISQPKCLLSCVILFTECHRPCGSAGIFSLNSSPFRPFQHLQRIMDEWEASSCSCSLWFFFNVHLLSLLFVSASPSFLPLCTSFVVTCTSVHCLSAKLFQRKLTGGERRFFFCARPMIFEWRFQAASFLLSFFFFFPPLRYIFSVIGCFIMTSV